MYMYIYICMYLYINIYVYIYMHMYVHLNPLPVFPPARGAHCRERVFGTLKVSCECLLMCVPA